VKSVSSGAESGSAPNDKKNLIKQTDPHIPQFKFKDYPDLAREFDDSPRILDEVW